MASDRAPTIPETVIAARPSAEVAQRQDFTFCPRCGRRNDRGEIFCQVCALPLQPMRSCRNCAAAIPSNAAYCPACGRAGG